MIEELLKMADDIKETLVRNEELGLGKEEIAFYNALAERPEVLKTMGDATLKQLATELTEQLRQSTSVDWQVRDSVRAKIRILIKRLLKKYKTLPKVRMRPSPSFLNKPKPWPMNGANKAHRADDKADASPIRRPSRSFYLS